MLFSNLPAAKPAARRAKSEPIIGVGWRAFVNWPQRPGQLLGPVPLKDPAGQALANDLVDGQEVEIVSWRPHSREGVTYQVRRLADGTEWWIAAVHMRRRAQIEPATVPPVALAARRVPGT